MKFRNSAFQNFKIKMSASAIIFYIISRFYFRSKTIGMDDKEDPSVHLCGCCSPFMGIPALYFWLQLKFIAAVQIRYVGGIVVLIIFSIFLTQQSGNEIRKTTIKTNYRFCSFTLFFCLGRLFCRYGNMIFSHQQKTLTGQFQKLVHRCLARKAGGYALPFEVVSIAITRLL